MIIKSKNPTERLDQSYSEKAEQKRKGRSKNRKRKPLRRGRVSTADKVKLAERTELVYPEGVPADQCKLSHNADDRQLSMRLLPSSLRKLLVHARAENIDWRPMIKSQLRTAGILVP